MEPPWAELTLSLGQLLLLQRERRCWIRKSLSKGNREREGSKVEGGLHQLYPSVLVCEVPIKKLKLPRGKSRNRLGHDQQPYLGI